MDIQKLLHNCQSPDAIVRFSAAGALSHLGSAYESVAGPALLSLLADPEMIVRSEAIDALSDLHYLPATDAIRTILLEDMEPVVRAAAAEALGELGDRDSLRELALASSDADASVRAYAVNAIGVLGDRKVVSKLEQLLRLEILPEVVAEYHGALYRLGVHEHLGLLLNMLSQADEDLAMNLLNIVEDLTRTGAIKYQTTGTARIRAVLSAVESRFPLLKRDVEDILDKLDDNQ